MSHLMGPMGSSYTYMLSSQPCPLLSPTKTKATSSSAGGSKEADGVMWHPVKEEHDPMMQVKEEHDEQVKEEPDPMMQVKEEHDEQNAAASSPASRASTSERYVEVYCGRCGRQFAPDFIKDVGFSTKGCNQRVYLHSCFETNCRPAENLPERQTIRLSRAQRFIFLEELKARGSTALRSERIRLVSPHQPSQPTSAKSARISEHQPGQPARGASRAEAMAIAKASPPAGGLPLPGTSEGWHGKRPPGMPPMMKMMPEVQEEQIENAEVYCARCGRQFAPDFIKDVGISIKGGDQSRKSYSLHCCFQDTCRAAENLPPRRMIMPTAEERSNFQSELRNWGSKALMGHEGGERQEEGVVAPNTPPKLGVISQLLQIIPGHKYAPVNPPPKVLLTARPKRPDAVPGPSAAKRLKSEGKLKPKARPITDKRKRDEVCPRPLSKTGPLTVQLVTAGWKNLHKARDMPIGEEPAPRWTACPRAADMEAQLKRLVCPEALQACQLMCCVIGYSIYIYIYICISCVFHMG